MSDNRPPVYYEDDVLIIRASAIGTPCLFELIAAGQGHEPGPLPEVIRKAFDKGHELENLVIEQWLASEDGKRYWSISAQEEGHLTLMPTLKVRFHPDGILGYKKLDAPIDPVAILEVKTLSIENFDYICRPGNSTGSLFNYNWQASVMMHATGLPLIWVAYNKGDKETGEGEGELHTEIITVPPIPYSEIAYKALQIKEGVDDEDILVSGRECNDSSHWPCRYSHLRPEAVSDVPVTIANETLYLSGEDAEEADRLARDYLYCKGQIDELEGRLDMAKERLLEIGEGHKRIQTDRFVVPIVNSSSSSYAWKEMPQELLDEVAKYKRKKPTRFIRSLKGL